MCFLIFGPGLDFQTWVAPSLYLLIGVHRVPTPLPGPRSFRLNTNTRAFHPMGNISLGQPRFIYPL